MLYTDKSGSSGTVGRREFSLNQLGKKKFETNRKNLYSFNRACKIYSPGLISSEGSRGLMIGMAGNHAFRT